MTIITKVLLNLFIVCVFILTAPYAKAQGDGFDEIDLTDFSLELGNNDSEGVDLSSSSSDQSNNDVLNGAVTTELDTPPQETLNEAVTEDVAIPSQAAPVGRAVPHSGTYYDSNSIGANALGGNSTGPREVDPKYEPGARFVVVQKTAGAGSSSARMVAAQRAIDLGRYSSALELYGELYKESPKNQRVLMGLAVSQQSSGFVESAISTYEEILALNPNHVDAATNMLGLIKKSYPSIAYSRLQELWSRNQNNSNIAAELGLASAQLEQYDDAVRYLGVASSLNPSNASYLYNLAIIYDRLGEKNNALKLYEKALDVDSSYSGGRLIERDVVYERMAYLRKL